MKTLNVLTLTPKDVMVKEAFKRTAPNPNLTEMGVIRRQGTRDATYTEEEDNGRYDIYTQADFLRELDVNAHAINSLKYYPNPITQGDKKLYQKVKTRVAIAMQDYILTKRVTVLTGNAVDHRIASARAGKREQELLALFREGWEVKNLENAVYELILANGKTGDGALCFYLSGGRVGWRSFSYDKGDTLYPVYDPMSGELAVFGRKYTITTEDATPIKCLDLWDDTYYMRYEFGEKGAEVEGWYPAIAPTRHGFTTIPIVYERYGAPFWANSQSLIEAYENAMSQFCENNMAYALRILYSFGADMEMKATIDGTPTQITSPSTDAKVGFLEPADASESYKLQLENLRRDIMRTSFVVETPEIKSGADLSSLTVKMMFADAYLKGQEDAIVFQPALDRVTALFKYGYGIEIGRSSDFETFKVKSEIFPYIFSSETEMVNNIVQLKGIGAMSAQSASEQAYGLGYGIVGEYTRITQEEHDALVAEADLAKTDTSVNVINEVRNSETL